jgi:hypothetical protein
VDDKVYLAEHQIDRNKVALELQRIFSQMVHLDGWFHAVSKLLFQSSSVLIIRILLGSASWYA